MPNIDNIPKLVAPYVPFKSFLTSLDYLNQGLPNILDRTVWPTFSGGLAGQMLAAYRFLGFITDDHEAEELLTRAVDPDKRKDAIMEGLRRGYRDMLELDLSRATPKQLADFLTEMYNVTGSTHKKALTFFLHAAKFVDLQLSPSIARKTRTSSMRRRRQTNGIPVRRQSEDDINVVPEPRDIPPPKKIPAQDSLLLWGLFERLPKPGSKWSRLDREKWLETLQNVFSLEYLDVDGL